MAEEMYPSEVNAGVRGMMFGNEPAQSQPDAPSWSMGNDYSPSRFENGFYNRFQSTNNRNQVRSGLNMGIRNGIDVGTLRKTIEEQKQAYDQLDQEYSNPINVDRSRLTGLQNQYATNMAQAPMMQAPVQPQVNDTVAGVSALAALLSPQQMRGRIAMAPFQSAQMSADRQNQQNQQQYAIESQNFGSVMKGLAAQIDQEAEQVKQQYGVEVDKKQLLVKRMNDIMDSMNQTQGQIVGADKAKDANYIKQTQSASKLIDSHWKSKSDGIYTMADYQADAKQLQDMGIDPNDVQFPPLDTPYIKTVDINADNTRADAKFNFDTAKWGKEFGLKIKSQADRVAQFDKSFNEKVREFEKTYGRQLTNDEFRQAYQKGMMEIAQQRVNVSATRENRSAADNGGGGKPNPLTGTLNTNGEPPPLSRKEAGRKVALATGEIKKLRAEQQSIGDTKKRAEIESKIKGLAAARDYYQGMINGEVKPFEPPPLKAEGKPYWDAVNQIVQSGKDMVGKGEKVGIPIGNSYAEGGNKTQYGTQNPPAQTKPAKSPQNAKKGQNSNEVTVNGKNLPYKFK